MCPLDRELLLTTLLISLCLVGGIIEPFDLGDVSLDTNTFQSYATALNSQYLYLLEPDRLLWTFRRNANLPTPNEPFYDTWEAPNIEVRGQFMGHYLTALSYAYRSTGEIGYKQRVDYLVVELQKVQVALGNGYLSAFPEEHFDRLQSLTYVWAPYYVVHKMMNGLLDAHALTQNPLALGMVEGMAEYFFKRIVKTLAVNGTDHWHQMLETEFGGMNDVLYRLYLTTRDAKHLYMASLFDKPNWYEPLAAGVDAIPFRHANTHLAQVNGFAARYVATSDPSALAAVSNFFDALTSNHSYATGGSNDNEGWGPANHLADAVLKETDATETEETCTQYNVLKLARSLFMWTGQVRYADFYERALLNGIIGVMRSPPRGGLYAQMSDAAGQRSHRAGPGEHSHTHGDHMHGHTALPMDGHTHAHGLHLERQSFANDDVDDEHAELRQADGPAAADLHRRPHRAVQRSIWVQHEQDPSKNLPGPGVYTYLLPMGTGQSKGDNRHGWGFPFHSFWCCYGTAVESFAKLHDSVYFRDMQPLAGAPRLYINQYVSSTLRWAEAGVRLVVSADMYHDRSAAANITISTESAKGAAFVLMLRIPSWTAPSVGPRQASVVVNKQAWKGCNFTAPGTYCNISRTWLSNDTVQIVLPMKLWWKGLPEERPALQNLTALMMGPFVMAGLTHDTRVLRFNDSSPDLDAVIEEPDTRQPMTSFRVAWQKQAFLRHDRYAMFSSVIEDSGDALDGTFRLLDPAAAGCGTAQPARGAAAREEVGSAGAGKAVMLQPVGLPGFFVGYGNDSTLIVDAAPRLGDVSWCKHHQFLLHSPGLTANTTSISLEALSKPGYFVSAFRGPGSLNAPCDDAIAYCQDWAKRGECTRNPEYMNNLCRLACGMCHAMEQILMVQQGNSSTPGFALASTFYPTDGLAELPQGSKVLKAANRHYLVAPLGNIVDERYTAYFELASSQMQTGDDNIAAS